MATVGLLLGGLLLALAPVACDGGIPSSERARTIPKETFIQTMVELRLEAARTMDHRITPGQRDRILAEMGVTDQELIRFAEVHGGNVPFMHEVWLEVDRRLREYVEEMDLEELEDGEVPPLVDPPTRPTPPSPGRIRESGS